jgi:hypothetical protein
MEAFRQVIKLLIFSYMMGLEDAIGDAEAVNMLP